MAGRDLDTGELGTYIFRTGTVQAVERTLVYLPKLQRGVCGGGRMFSERKGVRSKQKACRTPGSVLLFQWKKKRRLPLKRGKEKWESGKRPRIEAEKKYSWQRKNVLSWETGERSGSTGRRV